MTTARPQRTPSGAQTTPNGEIRSLTGLRIVAAVWVVLFHFHFTGLAGVTEVVSVLGPLITSGALGVDLFFVLSGFVIAHTYLDSLGPALRADATAGFVWARFCRMWPVYALVFHLFGLWLLVRLVFGSDDNIAFQGVQPVLSVGEWLEQLVMVQMWSSEYLDGASWVGPTWSISAEWLAYLIFPVAALVFYRMRNLPVVVLGLAALALMVPIAASYVAIGNPYYPYSWAVRILCGFGAGVLVHLVVRRLRRTDALRRGASVLAGVLPVLMAAVLWAGDLVAPGRGGVVIIAFPLLVGALAVADRGPARILSQPWAVQGGRVSYCLYLVHIPMFELFWLAQAYVPALGRDTVLGHVVGVGVVLATYPVAAATFRWVEEPARRRMRGMRRAPSPVVVQGAPQAERIPQGAQVPAPRRDPVAAVLAARAAGSSEAGAPAARHAASSTRQPTLAAVLVNMQKRRPTHRADTWATLDRTQRVRAVHAGN